MTTDESFATVTWVEIEKAKKKAYKEDDDKVAKEAVAKNKKLRAKKKGVKSVKKPCIRATKSNPKL